MNLTVHIKGVGKFAKFRTFVEISDIIAGKVPVSGFMMYGGRKELQG
jgi:hypothetical protein